jgi:hypothetical protein
MEECLFSASVHSHNLSSVCSSPFLIAFLPLFVVTLFSSFLFDLLLQLLDVLDLQVLLPHFRITWPLAYFSTSRGLHFLF